MWCGSYYGYLSREDQLVFIGLWDAYPMHRKIVFAAWACQNEKYGSAQLSKELFRKIFDEVVIFDPQKISYLHGRAEMNRMLIELVRKEQPDYLFLWLIYDEIFIDTLMKIREASPKTKLLNFFGDDDTLYKTQSRFLAPFLDGCFVVQIDFLKNYRQDGIKNAYQLAGVNTEYYRPLALKKKYDVSFIGTPKSDRYKIIKFLIANGINVAVFGAGWEQYPDIQAFCKGAVSKKDLVPTINESKISISFTKNYEGKPHYKGRVAEICGCRSFLITEHFEGYYGLFRKNELVTFHNESDLLDSIRYYLKHEDEREQIAKRACKRVVKHLSLEKELRTAFRALEKITPRKKDVRLQIIQKSIAYLSKEDFTKKDSEIINKIKNAAYIGFKEKDTELFPYKDYFQIESLEKSKNEISCCDYYVNSRFLGDYLAWYSQRSFNVLLSEKFHDCLRLDQLLMRRSYFLKNIEKIRSHFGGSRQEFIKKGKCSFVSIPLLRLKKFPPIDAQLLDKVSLPKYEDTLRALWNQRILFFHPFVYALLVRSIMYNRPILRRTLQRTSDKIKQSIFH